LEDELQRIRLTGNLDVHLVVTGVVCAVLGHEDGDGKFLVDDYCWAGLSEPVQRPLQSAGDRYNISCKYNMNAGWRCIPLLCQILNSFTCVYED
jgi:hypothetical protein